MLKVSVYDEGIGITPEKLAEIFKPFGQSSGTNQTAGNGVGLSICKQICEQLDGSISVSSLVGVGSKFTFRMKAYKATESEFTASTQTRSKKSKKSILHVIHEESKEPQTGRDN